VRLFSRSLSGLLCVARTTHLPLNWLPSPGTMITARGFSDDKVIADQCRYLLGTP